MIRPRALRASDAGILAAAFDEIGWSKPAELFLEYLREQEAGLRWVRVADTDRGPAGFVTLVWTSPDPSFRRLGVPEIMDLNVLPPFRARGVGNALMAAAESEAATRGTSVGLRVGLHSGYGAAQRLYVKRGYLPDGAGAIRHGTVVPEQQVAPLDDDLTLRLVLDLR